MGGQFSSGQNCVDVQRDWILSPTHVDIFLLFFVFFSSQGNLAFWPWPILTPLSHCEKPCFMGHEHMRWPQFSPYQHCSTSFFCCRWFILKAVPKCTISILALTEVIPYRRLLTIKLSINALLLLPQTGSPSIHGPERWMSWFMSQSHFGVFLYVRCKPLTANALTISWFKTLVATHINIALGLIESHWKSLCTWG